jgi:hypothetical protein
MTAFAMGSQTADIMVICVKSSTELLKRAFISLSSAAAAAERLRVFGPPLQELQLHICALLETSSPEAFQTAKSLRDRIAADFPGAIIYPSLQVSE